MSIIKQELGNLVAYLEDELRISENRDNASNNDELWVSSILIGEG